MTKFPHRILLPCVVLAAIILRAEEPSPNVGDRLTVAELKRETPVDFEKEILPFLKNSCLACHNTTKAKGGLNLETPPFILKGGDTGPGVAPGKSAESLVFKAAAHLDRDLIMPPKDNKANAPDLKPDQLALLKLWIDQGARGEVRAAAPVTWLEQPPHLDPTLAIALTGDGQFAVAGRGNRIDVYHVPSRQFLTRLIDPQLGAGFTNAAHRDLVNALAFNADGTLLASAGYREVKLWSRSRDVQRAAFDTGNAVTALAVSPDRRWLATPAPDHAIAIWNFNTGRRERLLTGHSNAVTSLRFSPDSARLASLAEGESVRVCSVAEGAALKLITLPASARAISWLADATRLAVGCDDGSIRIVRVATSGGESSESQIMAKEAAGQSNAVTALESLADGTELLAAGADGTLRHWSVEDRKVLRVLTNGTPVTAIAPRADGKRFAAAGTNGVARLWNAEDGKLLAELKGDRYANELVAETERALSVAKVTTEFHEKARDAAEAENKKQFARLAKAAETNAATEKIFVEKKKAADDAEAAKTKAEKELTELLTEIQKITESFEKAEREARDATTKAKSASVRVAESRLAAERAALSKEDAEKIATDAAAVAARTRAATGNDLPPEARAIAQRVAEDAASVAVRTKALAEAVTADAEMKKKLAADAHGAAEKAVEEVAALSFAAGQLKPAYDKTLAEAPTKRKQATNTVESAAKALTTAAGELKKAGTRKGVTGHELELAEKAAQRASNAVVSAKAVLETAVAAQRETDAALDARRKAAAAPRSIITLAFSPDGRTLATAGDDRKVHTWSAETGAAFDVFTGHMGAVHAVTFVDDTTLVSAGADQRAIAWDLNPPWTLARTLGTGEADSPLADRVNAVDFSPDGRTLGTGSGEPTRSGEVMLWNLSDGKLLNSFTNVHSDAVLALDFSPDGKYIASAAADRFVRVVELATGRVVKAFEGHTSYVLGVAWKRDSRTLASAGADRVIKVWDFVTGERRKNIEGAEKEVTAISFVGATGEAVAASGDSQVRLMRENGEKVRSFEGAGEFMNAVAVTPDGLTVVAGGQDGTMHIWNGTNGAKVISFAPVK